MFCEQDSVLTTKQRNVIDTQFNADVSQQMTEAYKGCDTTYEETLGNQQGSEKKVENVFVAPV